MNYEKHNYTRCQWKSGKICNRKTYLPAGQAGNDEVDYEITHKGEPEKGSVISRKSIAAFVSEIINNPDKYRKQNLGINKPGS